MTELEQMVADSVARSHAAVEADREAERLAALPTLEEQLHEAHFREAIAREALAADVTPRAVRHVVRDAVAIFELRGKELVPRNGATDPSDPLSPLSPATWLQTLRKSDPYLFTTPSRAH